MVRWIKRLPPKRTGSNLRSVVHLGDRWQLAAARLLTAPDLRRPYLVLLHFKFKSQSYRFPNPLAPMY